jgi:hypothetical protein
MLLPSIAVADSSIGPGGNLPSAGRYETESALTLKALFCLGVDTVGVVPRKFRRPILTNENPTNHG